MNDLTPPRVSLLTTTVAAGRRRSPSTRRTPSRASTRTRPPLAYGNQIIGAAAYDRKTGTIVIPLPAGYRVDAASPGHALVVLPSDYQESKNLNTIGAEQLPNTAIKGRP